MYIYIYNLKQTRVGEPLEFDNPFTRHRSLTSDEKQKPNRPFVSTAFQSRQHAKVHVDRILACVRIKREGSVRNRVCTTLLLLYDRVSWDSGKTLPENAFSRVRACYHEIIYNCRSTREETPDVTFWQHFHYSSRAFRFTLFSAKKKKKRLGRVDLP